MQFFLCVNSYHSHIDASNLVRPLIRKLRGKLRAQVGVDCIRNVRGQGYLLEARLSMGERD